MATDDGRVRVASALEATGAWEGPLDVDLGNLLVSDAAPLDPATFAADAGGPKSTAASLERGRDVLQRLVADLFSLPSESDVNGRFVQLPRGTTSFPRTKPLPLQEKPMTKWEKFAKEKGIKKRKRSKNVFDEQTDDLRRRRHGKDRAGDANKIIIMDGKLSEKAGTSVVRPRTRSQGRSARSASASRRTRGGSRRTCSKPWRRTAPRFCRRRCGCRRRRERAPKRCRWGRWARNRSGT